MELRYRNGASGSASTLFVNGVLREMEARRGGGDHISRDPNKTTPPSALASVGLLRSQKRAPIHALTLLGAGNGRKGRGLPNQAKYFCKNPPPPFWKHS